MRERGWKCAAGILTALALLILPSMVSADLYLKQVTNTEAFEVMGQKQPARSDTTEIWMGEKMGQLNMAGASVIIDKEKAMMYVLDRRQKSYYELSFDILGDLEKMIGDSPEAKQQLQMMQGMLGMMKLNMSVTPTEETMKIKDWNCRKYDVAFNLGMAKGSRETWASEDIKYDPDMLSLLTTTNFNWMPGFKEAIEEMKKVKGVMVQSDQQLDMMGNIVKSRTLLQEAATKSAPEGTYVIPEDFVKGQFDMSRIQR